MELEGIIKALASPAYYTIVGSMGAFSLMGFVVSLTRLRYERKIKKGFPPYKDGQLYFNFMKDYF